MSDDSRVMYSVLLDFYGGLLTDKQRECFDLHYNEDLSLSEIAEQSGISRQGVWDNIRRAELALTEIEEKTGLVHRFSLLGQELSALAGELSALSQRTDEKTGEGLREALSQVEKLRRTVQYGI